MTPAHRSPLRPLALTLAMTLGMALPLTGCKTSPPAAASAPAPDRHEVQAEPIKEQRIAMPSGIDLSAVRLIEQGKRPAIYVELLGIDDPRDKKLMFRPSVAAALGITNAQMRRRFVDTMLASRRFEVYEMGASVTADKSDLVVSGMVTQVTQELVRQPDGGTSVSRTRVELSLQGKHRYDENHTIFPGAVVVTGQTGATTGDRAVVYASERPDSSSVQERLAVDYERALRRALDLAARKVAETIRPMGKVVSVDGEQLGMLGGQAHGFQGKDEVVIFRGTTIKLPSGAEEFASTRPVAVARCDGVGVRTSQCVLIRKAPGLSPQNGDFAVLSDFSAAGARLE